jgi:lipopolysaccharide biosynthesis protein
LRFRYHIDNPTSTIQDDKRLTVRGWLLPLDDSSVISLRIKNNDRLFDVIYGQERKDVSAAYPDLEPLKSRFCGFHADLEFEDGILTLESDFGNGYEEVWSTNIKYGGERVDWSSYNPYLANNWAEHNELLEAKKTYFYEEAQEIRFRRMASDPKLVAFYLPQYHPIPENDRNWGKGFTEWRNVAQAQPRFIGHNQPLFPSDLGYYDLRVDEVIESQVNLAKRHGLYGFCFYYYWFSGKKVLDRPLNSFLEHKSWNFNFMICWANENWTKRWDGLNDDVIIAQKYLKDDPLKFIQDIENILLDERYIRINNRPVLAVYRTADLKDPSKYSEVWRQYFKNKHKLELHLVSVMSFDNSNPQNIGFDAGIEFVPQGINLKSESFENSEMPKVDISQKLIDSKFEGSVLNYRKVVLNKKFHDSYPFPTYKCVMPSWDNDARKKGKGSTVFYYESPDLYAHWLDIAIDSHVKEQKELTFINAWNEWAEGTTLEPSIHYGHAILNRTSGILSKYRQDNKGTPFFAYGINRNKNTKAAAMIHISNADQWLYIKDKLQVLDSLKLDFYITITGNQNEFRSELTSYLPQAKIINVPKWGQDVLPFVHLARRLSDAGYTSVLKLHFKELAQSHKGQKKFKEAIDSLLPSLDLAKKALDMVSTQEAIIGPKDSHRDYSKTEVIMDNAGQIGFPDSILSALGRSGYFENGMFWVNLKAIKPLLDLYLMPEDFESKRRQSEMLLTSLLEKIFAATVLSTSGHIFLMNKRKIYRIS